MPQVKNQYRFTYPQWDLESIFHIRDTQLVHQINTVLRCKVGDVIILLNGIGGQLLGKLIHINKKEVICEPIEYQFQQQDEYAMHLAIGTPKKNALKDICKYATQIGICSLSLVDMEYSQIKSVQYKSKEEYWKDILQESMEQSHRFYIPDFYIYASIQEFLKSHQRHLFVADIAASPDDSLSVKIGSNLEAKDITLLIGPEGGISSKDIVLLQEAQAEFYSLSTYILRVETAAISSLVDARSIISSQTLKK